MKKIFLTITLVLFIIPIGISQDLPSYVPTDGLVAFYPFNGNANDASGNGKNGTVDGADLTEDRFGNENSAYNFNGDNSIINLPELDSNIGTPGAITSYSMWFKGSAPQDGNGLGQGNILHAFVPGNGDYYIRFEVARSTENPNLFLKVYYRNPNDNNEPSKELIDYSTQTWHNITVVADGISGLYNYYFNGVNLPEMSFSFNPNNDYSNSNRVWQIGRINPAPNSLPHAFLGQIDDIGIWNRALTEQEIQNLYNSSTGDILLNGTVSAENNQIKNVADPTHTQDAVTLGLLLEKISNLQDQIDALQSTSGSGTVTDQDGNSYPYLTYGDQVWTVKNAEMVTYRDGTPIPQVTDATEWANLTTGAWCYYDNDPNKGKLYNWYAVAGIHDNDENTPNKELAPEGWHVPTDAEWSELENYLIANGYNYDGTTTGNKIAKAMSSTTGWNGSTSEGTPGNNQFYNNSSGFNAFAVGSRYDNSSSFYNKNIEVAYWTNTEFEANSAMDRSLNFDIFSLRGHHNYKISGFSVRFVRD